MKTMIGPSNVQYFHYSGKVWLSEGYKERQRFNVAVLQNNELKVLGYVPQGNPEDAVIKILKSYGWFDHYISYLLAEEDEIIMCTVCNQNYYEGDVNIVDYEDDMCILCEAKYKETINK
ncbi:hypothetical protein J2W98_003656 [Paenibacillus peoriae]|uniref:DNA-binding protein n=1 Tax=Paenibacillus peoriae TaxID=59893 RepID=A0ABU1QIA4_9BACL|nr:hypothetical protein [Paenibacillus peoriae]MDR6779376.1 hypothetical protein [Paenibacillus peoriae]